MFDVASVVSNAMAPIAEVASVSVSGSQFGLLDWAFVVFQMPPLTAPM